MLVPFLLPPERTCCPVPPNTGRERGLREQSSSSTTHPRRSPAGSWCTSARPRGRRGPLPGSSAWTRPGESGPSGGSVCHDPGEAQIAGDRLGQTGYHLLGHKGPLPTLVERMDEVHVAVQKMSVEKEDQDINSIRLVLELPKSLTPAGRE